MTASFEGIVDGRAVIAGRSRSEGVLERKDQRWNASPGRRRRLTEPVFVEGDAVAIGNYWM